MKLMTCLKIVIICLIGLTAPGLIWGVDLFFAARPPEASIPTVMLESSIETAQVGLRKFSDCYAFEREGIAACYLSGEPEIRGAALGRFYAEEFSTTETSIMQTIRCFIPSPVKRWLAARYVTIRQAKIVSYFPLSIQKEIYGFMQMTENQYPQYGSYYNRLIQSQTLYDIAHQLEEKSNITGTAFGITSQGTRQSTPLLARTFDFAYGDTLDHNKLVLFIRPRNGYAFLSVAWPGMFGVVSGMNEAGLGIAVLAGHSSDISVEGVPVSMLARQVLTEAGTLKRAVDIIRSAPVLTAESFLIGSGTEDHFIVVEKTPQKTMVREMQNGFIVATNHFLSPQFRDDPVNRAYQQSGPSLARLRRLKELLRQQFGSLDIAEAAAILRDRRGEFGVRLGLGNLAAINSLTSIHSVIFDLKEKKAWVSQYPHQLGKFVPFSLETFSSCKKEAFIGPDPFLQSGKYNEYLVYRHGLQEAERFYQEKKYQESLAWLQEVYPLNPLDYRSFLLAGRALQVLGRIDEASYNYQQAKKMHPAFFWEKVEIDNQLEELRKSAALSP